MINTVHRVLAGTAVTVLLSGVGALICTEPAAAAVTTPSVAAAVAPSRTGVPVHIPVNVCGNTDNEGSGLNPAFGNTCVND
jgi:hypothetical protein